MATRYGTLTTILAGWSVAVAQPVVGPPAGRARPVGELMEFRLPLQATFENPYDPHQVDLRVEVELPDGQQVTVPAFHYTPFAEHDDGTVTQAGDALWMLRFTAWLPGRHIFVAKATDRTGEATAPPRTIDVPAGATPGFIRVSAAQPRYLAFDHGQPYLPNGINLFFMSPLGKPLPAGRLATCRRWLNLTADHGGNFARLRMDAWWHEIECTADEATGYRGLGWYHPQAAWEIDQFYEIAAARGLYFMHCLWNANANVNDPQEAWRQPYNPYVKANGGPVERAEEFWTDPVCRDYQRRKLRYCVARWGASRHLMAWEFFNEIAARPATIDLAATWHAELADYLRSIDPWRHPITTSAMGDRELAGQLWELPQMEIGQEHVYGETDIPAAMAARAEYARRWNKPYFFGEYGIGPLPGNVWNWDFDTAAVHVHNGLWAALASGTAGPAAYWFINNFMEPKGCFPMLAPFAAAPPSAVADFPWTAADLRPVTGVTFTWPTPPAELHQTDVVLPTSNVYTFRQSPETRFAVQPDGAVPNREYLRPHLYCSTERKSPPTFVFKSPRPFEFVIHVTRSVGDERNRLLVYLDGRLQLDQPFPAGEGRGTAQRHIPQYNNWSCDYDERLTIPVPAGDHELRLEATGKDRLEVEYLLRGYVAFEHAAPLRAYGQRTGDEAWLWVHNRSSTWLAAQRGEAPIAIDGMVMTVPDLPAGDYLVEPYDTWQAKPLGSQRLTSRNGALTIPLGRVERDGLWRVRPAR